MLWALFSVMLAVAVLVFTVPLYRSERKLSATSGLTVVGLTLFASVMYMQIGSPNIKSNQDAVPNIEEMVSALALRMEETPTDLNGWKMLGRSYLQLQNFSEAVQAYEEAVALEFGSNSQTLADLGEAIFLQDQLTLGGRAGQLFEQAIAITPNNPKALFYSGMAAAQSGKKLLAAERWEALLATSPPEEIRVILEAQIAMLRETHQGKVNDAAPSVAKPGITVDISLGIISKKQIPPDTPVFIIARDPDQPSPPIAVVRRNFSQLPTTVPITEADSMIAGRSISTLRQVEVIARIALSGTPIGQSGDLFGQRILDTDSSSTVRITIDTELQ